MFELFTYDKVTDEIVIDNPYLFTIPEFKKLWMRVNKIKGDSDGRNKLHNKREFMYVFYMENLSKKNPYRVLEEDLRHKESLQSCELEVGYKPDEIVIKCREIYRMMILEFTPTLKFLVQLEQTIMQVARQVELIKSE